MISSSIGRVNAGFQKALSELEGQEAQRRAQQQRQAQQQQQAGQAGGASEAGGCGAGGGAGGENGSGIQRPDAGQQQPQIDPQVQADARQAAARTDENVRQQVESGCRCRSDNEPTGRKPQTGIDPALKRAAEENGQNDQNALDRIGEANRASRPQTVSDEMRRAAEANGQNDQNALDRIGEANRGSRPQTVSDEMRRAAEANGQNDQNALDRIGEANRIAQENAQKPPATFTHHARTGESLNDIAQRYGKTLTEMRAANPNLPFGSPLGAGVEVNVPRSTPNLTPKREPAVQGPVMVA